MASFVTIFFSSDFALHAIKNFVIWNETTNSDIFICINEMVHLIK